MTESALPWCRIKAVARHNPKIQRLPPADFKHWFNLLCLACDRDGYLPGMADIAYELRIAESKARSLIADLIARRLVDETPDGRLRMHDWDEHQFRSDVSTTRVKRFRERHAKRDETVSETPPEQSRAETEQSRGSEAIASAGPPAIVTPLDLKREVWRVAKRFLGTHGIAEKQAGELCGRWLKALGPPDSETALVGILASAEANCQGDVVEYVAGCIRARKNGNGRVDDGEDRTGFGAAVAAARAVASGG